MSESVTPRDVKILHLILASMGVTSYQQQVSLQLMDFAHRYTVNVLSDALLYNDYANASNATQPAGIGASSAPLTVEDVRLAISARVSYQFKPAAPKELYLELAHERNKRPLPPIPPGHGLRLPPEKDCLTGRDRTLEEDADIVLAGFEAIPPPGESEADVKMDNNNDDVVKEDIAESQAEGNASAPEAGAGAGQQGDVQMDD